MTRTLAITMTAAAATLFTALTAQAETTVYTDRAAWQAAAGGGPFEAEDFNAIPGVYYEIIDGIYYHYPLLLGEGHNYVGNQ